MSEDLRVQNTETEGKRPTCNWKGGGVLLAMFLLSNDSVLDYLAQL